ncbi:MAG: hypothetical protein U0T77_06905 [Chitinophagales bacterium]
MQKNLGMSVDAINPSNIRIFGHRAGMLPELAGAEREDDIKEIPVKIVASTPGRFQSGDYVLAFLPGPEKWSYNTVKQAFVVKKHHYSDTKNFFITADAGTGSGIPSVNPSALPENKTITTYDDYDFWEENKVNVAQSEKILGDEFGGLTDKSYNFNMPNLISAQPAKLMVGLAASAFSMGSTFTISTNNSANTNSIYVIPTVAQPYQHLQRCHLGGKDAGAQQSFAEFYGQCKF